MTYPDALLDEVVFVTVKLSLELLNSGGHLLRRCFQPVFIDYGEWIIGQNILEASYGLFVSCGIQPFLQDLDGCFECFFCEWWTVVADEQ